MSPAVPKREKDIIHVPIATCNIGKNMFFTRWIHWIRFRTITHVRVFGFYPFLYFFHSI